MAEETVDFLRRVRDGQPLVPGEVAQFVARASAAQVPDYQQGAFLMAVYHRGLAPAATAELTLAMRDSGRSIPLQHLPLAKVDKHSTGGVGDKISLHLAPWVAACGVAVPMVAGRGLGHTGGTLDKLESIPGFSCRLSIEAFVAQVTNLGVAIMGQSEELAPADRRFYALRDVTATVESIPLITASILAKKLAEGIDGLVLDVKVGQGAFMKDAAAARTLARSLIRVGQGAGLGVRALLTRMDAPLGRTIGNALEVQESIRLLQGEGPQDVLELSLALGEQMLLQAGRCADAPAARALLLEVLHSGAAWQRFRAMVAAQGGDVACLDAPDGLPKAAQQTTLASPTNGYVSGLDGYALGHALMRLGAGRSRAEDAIDPAVGLFLHHGVGDPILMGAPWLTIHHQGDVPQALLQELAQALTLSTDRPQPQALVLETLGPEGVGAGD